MFCLCLLKALGFCQIVRVTIFTQLWLASGILHEALMAFSLMFTEISVVQV
jgi:hypothetical protein